MKTFHHQNPNNNHRGRSGGVSSGVGTIFVVGLISVALMICCGYYYQPDSYLKQKSRTIVFDDGTTTTGTKTKTLSSPNTTLTTTHGRTAGDLGATTQSENNIMNRSASMSAARGTDDGESSSSAVDFPDQILKIPLPANSSLQSCPKEHLWLTHTKHFPTSNQLKWMTNCPSEISRSDLMMDSVDLPPPHNNTRRSNTPSAIYVGCNKALDAVNTLRMLSLNATYDKGVWRTTMNIEESACNQHMSPQFPILPPNNDSSEATVVCIEAMPSTFQKLNYSLTKLHWDPNAFQLHHAAITDADSNSTSAGGAILFPNARVGTEELGISHCHQKKYKHRCEVVPQYTLDTLLLQNTNNFTDMIDMLSIDVEGYDYLVLKGAPNILDRTRYLEFEYNDVGPWLSSEHKLSSAISWLSKKGFVCYWKGMNNNLWRITGCWIDIWDVWEQWSNIACVHASHSPRLATKMETHYQNTLQKKRHSKI